MYGDGLLILGDVVPFPVGLPTVRDDLNEDFALRDFRGLRDSLEVGLDVQLDELALFRFGVLRELQVNAGIGYGLLSAPPVNSIRTRDCAGFLSGGGDGLGVAAVSAPKPTAYARSAAASPRGSRKRRWW